MHALMVIFAEWQNWTNGIATDMESGEVETRDLRHAGQVTRNDTTAADMLLVARRGDKLLQLMKSVRVEQSRLGIIPPAMDKAMETAVIFHPALRL